MSDSPSRLPSYQRVADALRSAITTGEVAPGEPFETEGDLATRFGVSRGTVRQALGVLKAEGLVVSQRGSRSFVRERPPIRLHGAGANYRERRQSGLSNFNAEMAAQGRAVKQNVLEAAEAPAPGEVAAQLGLADGASVAVRRIVALVDGHPTQLTESYFPLDIARGTPLLEAKAIRGGGHAVLEGAGFSVARFVEDLEARMPAPDEVAALKIPPGVPIIRTVRTAYDTSGRAVEVLVSRLAADGVRFRYVIDVP